MRQVHWGGSEYGQWEEGWADHSESALTVPAAVPKASVAATGADSVEFNDAWADSTSRPAASKRKADEGEPATVAPANRQQQR